MYAANKFLFVSSIFHKLDENTYTYVMALLSQDGRDEKKKKKTQNTCLHGWVAQCMFLAAISMPWQQISRLKCRKFWQKIFDFWLILAGRKAGWFPSTCTTSFQSILRPKIFSVHLSTKSLVFPYFFNHPLVAIPWNGLPIILHNVYCWASWYFI